MSFATCDFGILIKKLFHVRESHGDLATKVGPPDRDNFGPAGGREKQTNEVGN